MKNDMSKLLEILGKMDKKQIQDGISKLANMTPEEREKIIGSLKQENK